MGAACYKSASPASAPPPYEEPGYKPSHYGSSHYEPSRYEPSHYGASHYGPSHYAPPSYTIQCSVTHAVPATTIRQTSTQQKFSNSVQHKVASPTQRKVTNSSRQKATNFTQQKATNASRQKATNFTQPKVEKKAVTPNHDGDQYELMILGLPKANGHTPNFLAKRVALALGISISHGDIIDVYRIPGNGRKTQPLVIKFSSIELRDKWISLKQKKQGLLAHEVHPVFGNEKVSVVERLTPEDQALFEKVQRFSRQNDYRFVWTRHGDIFIRKTERAKAHLIQCADDLNNLRN